VRHLTGSRPAGLIAGLTFAYSGYLTGYPPLQLAILETDIWLPLILLLLHKALTPSLGPRPPSFALYPWRWAPAWPWAWLSWRDTPNRPCT